MTTAPGHAQFLISITPVRITGSTARLVVQARCSFSCRYGDRLVVSRSGGRWRVSAHVGVYLA